MAKPKLEKGYVKIANELYEAIARWHLSSYEYRVFIFIIRKTYGWNKKSDWISLSQFVEGTGIKINHVCRAISLLVQQNMITKGGNRDNPEYEIQKDFDKWKKLTKGVRSHHKTKDKINDENVKSKLPKGVIQITKGGNPKLPKGVIQITKGGNSGVKKGGDTIDTYITKDTITKDSVAKAPTPKENSEKFFEGVGKLMAGEDVPWLKDFLSTLSAINSKISKDVFWREIKKFYVYWTEHNSTGKKERWEMQKTFEVNRRLSTWFTRAGFSEFSSNSTKSKEIIGLN